MPHTDCLPCAKEIIDQRNRVEAEVERRLATLKQVAGCAVASVMMAPDRTVDEELRDVVVKAGDKFLEAVKSAAEAYSVVLTGLEKEARKKWAKNDSGS